MPQVVVFPSDVNAWTGRAVDASREATLVAAIAAATAWVERSGGRRSLGKETTAIAATLNGADAIGRDHAQLWLPTNMRPVWHSGADLLTVSENGTALTVAAGYSSTANVLIRNANVDAPLVLYRPGGWYSDYQNVVVTCKCGWDDPTAALLPIPEAVRMLVIEVAWLMFNGSAWVGKQNVSKAGSAVSIENGLSPTAQSTLDAMQGL